ncbi:MarR family transcriptional regulator [Streptomyces sp. NPDC004096]|uniref:MarR family transcriptional regulator n=1 Tax=unclassified Streptomyces TaxID=2593676 RepID=UPI0033AEB6D2
MHETGSRQSPEGLAEALGDAALLVLRHLMTVGDLSLTSVSTLDRLGRYGPARLTELAAAEGVAQPSMTQLVHRLVQLGLVRRVRHPGDRRVVLVAVTESGRELLSERQRVHHARLMELLTTLSGEDRRALTEAMQAARPLLRQLLLNATAPPRRVGTATASAAGS